MSWEQLTLLSNACSRRDADKMLKFMVACQGDEKSWDKQKKELLKRLKN